jgi:WD40 repeat protein
MDNENMEHEIVENQNEKNEDHLSVEEFEGEENDYMDDDNMIDDEELEELNKHFDIQITRGENQMEVEEEAVAEVEFKREFENFQADGEIYSIAMNEKGVLVVGDGEDSTYIYDLNKKELIRKEKINKDSVVNACFSHDGKYLATASLDGTVNLFDGEEFKLITTVNGSFSEINVK